jgi:hypothetical protein
MTEPRGSRHRWVAGAAAAWFTLTAIGSAVNAAPARAEGYPYCAPKVDADCFLLNQVNDRIAPIAPGQEGPLIAAAHDACQFMRSDFSGTNPMLDYSVWLGKQLDGDKPAIPNASQFALYAARAYCPSVLP